MGICGVGYHQYTKYLADTRTLIPTSDHVRREIRRDLVLLVRFRLFRQHTRHIYRFNDTSHVTADRPRILVQVL
jgi:hypothetical protein